MASTAALGGSLQDDSGRVSGPPAITLPKGGGAIRGIGEKFAANPVTGTGSMTVPIATTPGRQGFGPQLALSYDSGSGNGLFGFGWSLGLPAITRKTDKGLPRYHDAGAVDSDVFLLSGAEDLVPVLLEDGGGWDTGHSVRRERDDRSVWRVRRYRPRTEGLFARIERWTQTKTGEVHWRSISKDNVTTLYGRTSESRVADPADGTRVFAWLICESFDDKGNAIAYGYEAEGSENIDTSAAHEANRTDAGRAVNRHLKRIRYGNPTPHVAGEDLAARTDWLFEVVFDYGEHDPDVPTAGERGDWLCRRDPFSTHRPGFEVRTYRLCRRVLMFHHFAREAGVGVNCLVRSTDFTYRSARGDPDGRAKGHPVASFLASVAQSGYRRRAGGYLKRSQPPLDFEYSEPAIADDVRDLDADSVESLPDGVDGGRARWLDYDGEGLSGVLIEAAGGWSYKRNLGPSAAGAARLGPLEPVGTMPAPFETRGGTRQFLDLAGDGKLDLVSLAPPLAGYHERSADGDSWSSFMPFESLPRIDWDDPDLRLLDVSGDARADALVSRDGVVAWYPSLGEAGFGAPETVPQPFEDERGPRHVLADRSQSIFVADMCGDGLGDIVRIRNGEVSYWPNLGHGRFGARVAMDDAPWFDTAERFEPGRIRVDDIDGSGTGDLFYLGPDEVQVYFNQAGNGWGERHVLRGPVPGDAADVSVVDLLGNGTACLVWSSPSPADARRPIRYLDLMGGQKPHLLVGFRNNLGAETRIHYAPSTKFSAQARAAGRPWRTRLPFPVHVVERVETIDHVGRNRFVTSYVYEEGRFDGREREFCGFGHVKRWDTEELASLAAGAPPAGNIDAASHVPPVLTKTWIHTGAQRADDRVSRQFEADYYQEPGRSPAERRSMLLDDTVLPDTILRADGTRRPHRLSDEEEREACRALKGTILRQEIYAIDGTEAEARPYLVTEGNATVELLQPRGPNRHAVFFTHPRETLQLHYERALFPVGAQRLADPRVTHSMQLAVDPFGNVERTLEIGYGRRHPDPELPEPERSEQTRARLTCTENGVTARIDAPDEHRTPVPWEARTYELTVAPSLRARMEFHDAVALASAAQAIPYEQEPSAAVSQKRLVEHVRTSFARDDLGGALPFGQLQSPALPFETYRLAFTSGLVDAIYQGRVTNAVLGEAGYVHSAGDPQWWIPSGRVHYSPRSQDTPAQELAHARRHFFLPHRFRDPFHNAATSTESFVTYDEYDLLVDETRDALGNRVTAGERDPDPTRALTRNGQDYRVLQPALVMDPNRNRSAAAFDAFGMVAGTALMGKPEELPARGDALTPAFRADLTQDEIDAFFADPRGPLAATLLDSATTRVVYDLSADPAGARPAFAATLARETHADEPVPAGGVRIQVALAYSDGFGREIQRKTPAEPGPVPARDAQGRIVVGPDGAPVTTGNDVAPRWVGSGWTVFNNKGKPVRSYEPFFSDAHRFEFDVRVGVSAVLCYDPVDRVVATLHPDHTWEKVRFDPWRRQTWDVSDTVLAPDPGADPDVGGFFVRLPDAAYLPTWHGRRASGALGAHAQQAARKAEVHAGTPTGAYADTLGRTFLTVTHNRHQYSGTPPPAPEEAFSSTRVVLDIEGNEREIVDAEGRLVTRRAYDILGTLGREAGMEAGTRWTLHDVAGKPLYAWDSLGRRFETTYDRLRRPADSFLLDGAAERLIGRSVYGEASPDPARLNLRGKLAAQFDQAGKVTHDEYDFKGNVRRSGRELAIFYDTTLDWAGNVPLDGVVHAIETRYDALNRPTEQTAPDGSVLQRAYDESGRLQRVAVNLRGAQSNGEPVWTPFVKDVAYDARGRRVTVEYASGAGVTTTYTYDRLTSRLTNLVTRRAAASFPDDCPQPAPAGWPGCQVQNLQYTYDTAGNLTHLDDTAQQAVFFRNKRVAPGGDFTYDASYRLIEATGREHLGQAGGSPLPHDYNDARRSRIAWSANDGDALGRFLERFVYDRVGNIGSIQHVGTDPSAPGWRRTHTHDEPSQLEPGRRSNRLTSATIDGATEVYSTNGDGYDAHGCMLRMPQLHALEWDFDNRLRMTQRQAVDPTDLDGVERHGERTYYVYDGAGQRVRKVTELATGAVKDERVYLGGLEIFRRHGVAPLVRESLHVMDETQRIAIVETRTQGNEPGVPIQLVRYQFGNHLGSASLELDDQAQIVSYEEYTPYGSTSYQAVRSRLEAPKRYRYTGKERDEESGLYYHGARYYAPWLGRWTSCDPAGLVDGVDLYAYAAGAPTNKTDVEGTASSMWDETVHGVVEARQWVKRTANDIGAKSIENTQRDIQDLGIKNGLLKDTMTLSAEVTATVISTTLEVAADIVMLGPNLLVGLDSAGTNIGEGAARVWESDSTEESWLGAAQLLGGIGEGALVAIGVLSLGEGAAISGRIRTNPGMSPAQVLRGNTAHGAQFERHLVKDAQSVLTTTMEQVSVQPLTALPVPGAPLQTAGYRVRIDAVQQSRLTGSNKFLEGKGTAAAPLTRRQTTGFPLIEQYGGVVRGVKGGAALPAGTVLPPTTPTIVRPAGLQHKKLLQSVTAITAETELKDVYQ